ncbi:dynein light chain Tctex-type 5-B-like [Tubulanus polymorphus]|uniref:dynein light chain Tctex-type 5-B-like n=1 Tax=Tubulanus polymorphus TaxID=672921 RepID=UPI003DA61EB1
MAAPQIKDEPGRLLAPPTGNTRRASIASTGSQGSQQRLLSVRRKSTLRSVAHSLAFMRRMTKPTIEVEQKSKVKYENTYKTVPDPGTTFSKPKVEEIVNHVFSTYLDDLKYNAKECSGLAMDLSQIIQNRIKDLKFKRYKVVVNVVLGEKRDQGIEAASRCIWESSTDSFACVHYGNATLFAVATIHGIYYE